VTPELEERFVIACEVLATSLSRIASTFHLAEEAKQMTTEAAMEMMQSGFKKLNEKTDNA
jgi:hypothetical protein